MKKKKTNETTETAETAKKPKKNVKKRIIIALIILLAVILAVIGTAAVYITTQYGKIYEHVEIVERSDTYVMPAYPQLDNEPWMGEDFTFTPEMFEDGYIYTEPSSYETEPTPEIMPEETSASPAEEETTAPRRRTDVTKPVGATPEKPETKPVETKPVETKPVETKPAQTKPAQPTTTEKPQPGVADVTYSFREVPIYKKEQKDPNVMNILLIGTDSRNIVADRGRSDTMIVVSYNKSEGTVKMTSLLRDALVPIEGYDWNRLNTAYFFGGIGLAVNTINDLFDLDIQRFIIVDMQGAKQFINKIGGIDVTLTQAEVNYYKKEYGKDLRVGVNHLDGDMALAHLRNRTTDNDFGRSRRQRDVINAMVQKVLEEKSLSETLELVEYATGIVKTNIEFGEMCSLATSVVSQKDSLSIETQVVPYADAYKFAWYKKMAIISFDIEAASKRANEFIYG